MIYLSVGFSSDILYFGGFIILLSLLLSKRQRRQIMDLALSLSRDNHEKASQLRQVRKQRIPSQLNIEYSEELQAMRQNQGFAKAG